MPEVTDGQWQPCHVTPIHWTPTRPTPNSATSKHRSQYLLRRLRVSSGKEGVDG